MPNPKIPVIKVIKTIWSSNFLLRKSLILLDRKKSIARRVAICKKTKKEKQSFCTPNNFFKKYKCPELLTGKNSVNPCIMPKSTNFTKLTFHKKINKKSKNNNTRKQQGVIRQTYLAFLRKTSIGRQGIFSFLGVFCFFLR